MLATRIAIVLAAVTGLPCPGPAAAQTTYARPVPDTIRFHETTHGEVRIDGPTGTMRVGSEHEAVVAVRFGVADTAWGWYESLALASVGPTADAHPATAEMLRRPYMLRFTARGVVTTLYAPPMPEPIGEITDLTRQFDDFFISLPVGPLVPGTQWSDTLERTDAGRPGDEVLFHAVRSFHAARDTTIGVRRAIVIEVQEQLRLTASSPIGEDGEVELRAETVLEGTEFGIAVFEPATGSMLGRRRTGNLIGFFFLTGRGEPVEMPMQFTYSSTIERSR